jgi:nucleotide-binding universal stress UspA family protein
MGLEYHHILVAVDGSMEAELAFNKAIQMANGSNTKLLLVHIIDTKTFAYASEEVESFNQTISEKGKVYAAELLENYKQKAIQAGITDIDCVIDFGSPRVKIPKEIAKEHNCDLIICGATGLNGVERLFMGSVSEYITRYATCDVLIVRK